MMENDGEPILEQPSRDKRAHHKSAFKSARQYSESVRFLANTSTSSSLWSHPHLKPLSDYLQRPLEGRYTASTESNPPNETQSQQAFVTLHEFAVESETRSRKCHTIAEFESSADVLLHAHDRGHILFMQGYPSPEWLAAIGAKYDVDPIFFHGHLAPKNPASPDFDCPPIPSAALSMMHLRVTTLGHSAVGALLALQQGDIERARARVHAITAKNQNIIGSALNNHALGDSIMREAWVLDKNYFLIEQDISICVLSTGKSWTAIVWLDSGHSLDGDPYSKLTAALFTDTQKSLVKCLPTIQYHEGSLRSRIRHLVETTEARPVAISDLHLHQSASLLCQDYGLGLRAELASKDSFYALTDLLKFVASSEWHFLNLLEAKLEQELQPRLSTLGENMNLINVLYYRNILERHSCRVQENLATIESIEAQSWPVLPESSPADRQTSVHTRRRLAEDFQSIAQRINRLKDRSQSGMQIMMFDASIKESKKAIEQAQEVTNLTRLAFIFIPLSFLASLFGMNFREFGTGKLSLWTWAAVSGPVLLLSLMLIMRDRMIVQLRRWKSRKRFRAHVQFVNGFDLDDMRQALP